jgi:hypothetical protein
VILALALTSLLVLLVCVVAIAVEAGYELVRALVTVHH